MIHDQDPMNDKLLTPIDTILGLVIGVDDEQSAIEEFCATSFVNWCHGWLPHYDPVSNSDHNCKKYHCTVLQIVVDFRTPFLYVMCGP